MSMMQNIKESYDSMKESYNSTMENVRRYGKVSFLSAVVGAGIVGGLWINKHIPSERVASAPNRIIPAAADRAKGALNPDRLEVRVCDALPEQEGKETLFVYNGKMFLATESEDGKGIGTKPYTGDEWGCRGY